MCDFKDFTLFDIFKKKDKVYLILSINSKVITNNDLIVSMNSKILLFDTSYVKDETGPILVLIYQCEENTNIEDLIFKIVYNGIEEIIQNKEYIQDKKFFLTITTLFKDDYQLFPIFYDYYKNQGVEHFYLYYNGIITKKIKNYLNRRDVTLIQWNFRYWNGSKKDFEKKGFKYRHHAQMGQIHHAIYNYGKDNSEYMIFCDMDEYLHINGYNLKSFIQETNKDLYSFSNIWSTCINNVIPENFPKKFYISNEKTERRSKNIFKLEKVITICIHKGHKYTSDDISSITDLDMFHFYNWSCRDRIIENVNVKKIM